MHSLQTQSGYQLVLDRGEKVIASLTTFALEKGIQGATFQALGAAKDSTLAYYKLDTKEYLQKEFSETREVASLIGNIALVEGKPFVHAHAVLSDNDMYCVAGHVVEMTVAITLEISLHLLSKSLQRTFNEDIGLRLLDLP